MEYFVDELPKKCADCPFYKLDTYVDVYGYQTNSHECVLDGSMLTNSCPLQSLADYIKQVRKEVCEEIGKNVAVDIINFKVYVRYDDLAKILDQIQGETK